MAPAAAAKLESTDFGSEQLQHFLNSQNLKQSDRKVAAFVEKVQSKINVYASDCQSMIVLMKLVYQVGELTNNIS